MIKKLEIGLVISNKMDKTCTILIKTRYKHSLYKKYYLKNRKCFADSRNFQIKCGDFVIIKNTRPLSLNKNFAIVKVLTNKKISI